MAMFQPGDELGVDHRLQLQHFRALGGPEVERTGLGNVIGAVEHTLVLIRGQSAAVPLQGGEGTPIAGDRVSVVHFPCCSGGGEQDQFRHLFGELLVLHGADLHEGCQGIPGFGVTLGILLFQVPQPVGHFLGDEVADGANASVGLQSTAAHVQGDIG